MAQYAKKLTQPALVAHVARKLGCAEAHAAALVGTSRQVAAKRRDRSAAAALPADKLAVRARGWVRREAEARAEAKAKAAFAPAEAAFCKLVRACAFRTCSQGHAWSVARTDFPFAKSVTDRAWGKKYPIVTSTHDFGIRSTWLEDVHARGLASIDGLVTLDASPTSAPAPAEAYTATWVRQGAGTSLVVESGAIVHLSPEHPWVHGPSSELALRTAHRRAKGADKAAAARRDAARAERQAKRDAAIAAGDWTAVWPRTDLSAVKVCLAHSAAAGNCSSGTAAWIAEWLPEYSTRECAPAMVVLAAVAQDHGSTRRLAVAAVHRAVLRHGK